MPECNTLPEVLRIVAQYIEDRGIPRVPPLWELLRQTADEIERVERLRSVAQLVVATSCFRRPESGAEMTIYFRSYEDGRIFQNRLAEMLDKDRPK